MVPAAGSARTRRPGPPSAHRGRGSVLIVDDDVPTCRLLDEFLGQSGFGTTWRASGEAALATLATEDVDLVLADYVMPGMNGVQLCEQILARRPDVPVVFITAYGSMETAVEAIRAGAADFVTKPFDLDALLVCLERAMRRAPGKATPDRTQPVRAPRPTPVGVEAFDVLPEAVLLVRRARIAWANGAAARLFGSSTEMLIGRYLGELIPSDEVEKLQGQILDPASGRRGSDTYRVRLAAPARSPTIVDLRVAPAGGADSALWLVTARDVTHAARTEELIDVLSGLYVTAAGRAMLDPDALLQASEPFFEALGWSVGLWEVEEAGARLVRLANVRGPVGRFWGPLQSLVGQVASFEQVPVVAEVVRTGRGAFFESAKAMAHGLGLDEDMEGRAFARGAWVPVTTKERVSHVLAVTGPDLTERDFVAVRLFAAQISATFLLRELGTKLARRERFSGFGEMSALLAHEIRTSAGVIFNAGGALRRLMRSDEGEGDVARLLGMVTEEGMRLKRLVDNLVDFARPLSPRLQPVSVAEVATQALAATVHAHPHASKEPDVAIEIADSVPLVQADPALLYHAIANLLANAFDAVTQNGRIEVRAEVEGSEVRLSVANDGPPIPADVRERIFEPFFTTNPAGAGLGLAVVQRIVVELGGRVAVDECTNGASFSFWLPLVS